MSDIHHWQGFYIENGTTTGPVNGEQYFVEDSVKEQLDLVVLPNEWFTRWVVSDEIVSGNVNQWNYKMTQKYEQLTGNDYIYMGGEFHPDIKYVHFTNRLNKIHEWKDYENFCTTSSSSDSVVMLYKLLTETKDDVITRILTLDASDQDLEQYPIVCGWLKENIRDFDFGLSEFEDRVDDTKLETIRSKNYNVALLSETHNVDLICLGINTYNWSHATWYFQTTEPVENFYAKDNSYSRIDHSILRDYTDISIEWIPNES